MTATSPALSGSVRVTQADRETVIDKVPVRKAVLMLHRGAVDLVEADDRYRIGLWPKPLIVATSIVSLSAVMDWRRYERTGAVSYSRDALRVRDRGVCAYCGLRCWEEGTMDHVMPRSRGGRAEWTNAVWACRKCNSDKADRTPREAGMPLLYTSPYIPTYLDIHDPIY